MLRSSLFLIGWLAIGATVVAAPNEPKIELSADGGGATQGEGTASVSGTVTLPPGWKLSIHTLTIRHAQGTGSTSLNLLLPLKGLTFSTQMKLKTGSYKIWAVIDVKDADGRERQITSEHQNINIQ